MFPLDDNISHPFFVDCSFSLSLCLAVAVAFPLSLSLSLRAFLLVLSSSFHPPSVAYVPVITLDGSIRICAAYSPREDVTRVALALSPSVSQAGSISSFLAQAARTYTAKHLGE